VSQSLRKLKDSRNCWRRGFYGDLLWPSRVHKFQSVGLLLRRVARAKKGPSTVKVTNVSHNY
jgi:hypothetical protein